MPQAGIHWGDEPLNDPIPIPSVKKVNTMYEVLAGNGVRKKLDKPEPKRTDYNIEHMTLDQEYAVFKTAYAVWKEELDQQPTYEISGSHNWKEGQLIEEGKDFELRHQKWEDEKAIYVDTDKTFAIPNK